MGFRGMFLVVFGAVTVVGAEETPRLSGSFSPVKSDAARVLIGKERPQLPMWAAVLAKPMPATVGGMLELDHLHRVRNPLGPLTAAKLRWGAAAAGQCPYAVAIAEADLLRAGMSKAALAQWKAEKWSPDDTHLMELARVVTQRAADLTDVQAAALVKKHGPQAFVAMVHTLAFAAFQNRIFLALGMEAGKDTQPACDLRGWDRDDYKAEPLPRMKWEETVAKHGGDGRGSATWKPRPVDELNRLQRDQQTRTPRIPPVDKKMLAQFPPEARDQAEKVVWTNIGMGYQPEMTRAWFDCMRTYYRESGSDPGFRNALFWVVTRTNDCFY